MVGIGIAVSENGWAERKDHRGGGVSVLCGCTSNDLNAVTQQEEDDEEYGDVRTATDRALRVRISLDAAAVAAARGRAGQPARHRGARVDTGWGHFVGGHEVGKEDA